MVRKRQLSMEVDAGFWEKIVEVQEFFGLLNWVAVVRYGVTLLIELKKATEKGHKFGVINEEGKLIEEIIAPHMSDT